MKTTKFYKLSIGDTFYITGNYARIVQYEKISDGYGLEILTNSSKWFDDEVDVYID